MVFGDSDEIPTAAAHYRVGKNKREKRQEWRYWRAGAKLTAGSQQLKMRDILGTPTPFPYLLYFNSYRKESSSA